MIGSDSSMQNLGIAPCAISWLFKLINERKEKTGTRFSVRVSAVEIYGKDESLQDLLSDVPTGSLQDGQSPGVYLREDPICGTQVSNLTTRCQLELFNEKHFWSYKIYGHLIAFLQNKINFFQKFQ